VEVKKMKIKKIVLIICLCFITISLVFAKNRTYRINKREKVQMRRIVQGVKTGELTREEAKNLVQNEREIQQMKKDAKSDGVVTIEERKELHKKLNQQSREIYKQKHDLDKR